MPQPHFLAARTCHKPLRDLSGGDSHGVTPTTEAACWIFATKQPHHFTFIFALVLAILGLLGTKMHIDYVSQNAFWFVLSAYVVLALGNLIVGL